MKKEISTLSTPRDFLKLASLFPKALAWYVLPPSCQYHDGELKLYHQAAETLTKRSDIGNIITSIIQKLQSRNTLPQEPKILEIASGTGLVAASLPSQTILSDLSHEALLFQHHQDNNLSQPKVTADFHHLPFKPSLFDVVVNVGGFRYVIDKKIFWQEMRRVLSLNGLVIIAQFYPRMTRGKIKGLDIGQDQTYKQLNFHLNETREHKTFISIGFKRINTGCYKIFVFKKVDNETKI